MKKIAVLLLTLSLTLPAFAQTPFRPAQKEQAMASMAMTPLASMDKDTSMLVAASSYECAAYYFGMVMVAQQLTERGGLDDEFPLEKFTQYGHRLGSFHVALSEIIHIIYDITEEQDMAIMMKQQEKVTVVINTVPPKEIDDKYEVPCHAILQTYLPTLFKQEEKNGA